MTVSPMFNIGKMSEKQGNSISTNKGQHLKLKIVSDIHLGYKNAD